MSYLIQGDTTTREYARIADESASRYWLQPIDGLPADYPAYSWGGKERKDGPLRLENKRDLVDLTGKLVHLFNARTHERDLPRNAAYTTPGGSIAAVKGRDEYTLIHAASGMTIPTEAHSGSYYARNRISRTNTLRDTKALALAIEATGLLPDTNDPDELRAADYKALRAFIDGYGTAEGKVAA